MVALITGGSSGMGLEFARELAARDYKLLLVSNRADDLESAAKELTAAGAGVLTHYADLAAPDAADSLFAWCQAEGIVPDILINNAGMFFFKEITEEDLPRVQAMLNLHIQTVTRLCILFGGQMKKRGSGYILNVSSMAARIPAPGITVYSATKAYLKSFGVSLSYELAPYGVSVTTVCPAAIATPLYRLDEKWMRLGVRIRLIHTPRWLVRRALRAMFRRRRLVQPSLMNVWLPPLIALLPGWLVAKIWKRIK
jgi:short-subunit dehydrogenase